MTGSGLRAPVLDRQWALVVLTAAIMGVVSANWLRHGRPVVALGGAISGLIVALGMPAKARLAALCVGLFAFGLLWGGARLAQLDESRLALQLGERGDVEATVVAPPRHSEYSTSMFVRVSRFGQLTVREKALLVLPAGRAPPVGAIIRVRVRIRAPRGPEDGFDESGWLRRNAIRVVLEAGHASVVGYRGGLAGLGDRLRRSVESALASGVSGERHAVLAGIVLGADEGLSKELKDAFRASGLYHLLAVSGQNVAFIVAGIAALAWLIRLSSLVAHGIAVLAILVYVLTVGWQPSVVRAGVAGVLASLAWIASRPQDRWQAYGLGALVLVAWSPRTVFDPGFQLSFVAVAAIFLLVPPIRKHLERWPLPFRLGEGFAIAAACGIGTAPVLLAGFGGIPAYGIIANLAAEPAVPFALALGLLAALAQPILPAATAPLAWLAGIPAAWLALCARLFASLPHAVLSTNETAGLAVLITAVCAVWGWRRRSTRRRRGPWWPLVSSAVLVAVAGMFWFVALRNRPAWSPPTGLRVTFLDVGQGDAALVEAPGGAILVDEGPPEARVATQLSKLGIRSLSAVVLTHPQRDHVGGAEDVVRRLHVGALIDPALPVNEQFRDSAVRVARERAIPVMVARAGQVFRLGRLRLRVLWPDGPGSRGSDPNDRAVVLLATYGETDVLLTADAESNVTSRLPLHAVEVLKVAHHGSADDGLARELAVLRPRVAVISVGAGNDYGHPREETLAALAARPGLRVYRTDRSGRIVIESDGRRLSVRPQRGLP